MTVAKNLGAILISMVTPLELPVTTSTPGGWSMELAVSVAPLDAPSSNRLSIVELAPAPEIAGQKVRTPPERLGCPFHLHAVIESETRADSFALVELDGEPEVVREGQQIRYGTTRFKVRRIARQMLLLQRGNQRVQCSLTHEESSK